MSNAEQADGRSKRSDGYHQFLKRMKRRIERQRCRKELKANPDGELSGKPAYGKYSGYET